MEKYGKDDADDTLLIDIRSLYRHEHIAPETLISTLYRLKESQGHKQKDMFSVPELFGSGLALDEIEKISEYYKHQDGWTNRLIQGDSLLVMTSEGMAGKVQMIYIDPPYGIKYGSNWQMKMNDRNVKDGDDDYLSGQPEQIKAYRDTWELGIHSYLGYLRDRLLVAKELLTESGSCFVQISDENVHLVRCIMDEVFGSGNFVSQITFKTGSEFIARFIKTTSDYLIWYGKNKEQTKYHQLYEDKIFGTDSYFDKAELDNGKIIDLSIITEEEKSKIKRYITYRPLVSGAYSATTTFHFELNGNDYYPGNNRCWKTTREGMARLVNLRRINASKNTLKFIAKSDDFPFMQISHVWEDTMELISKQYVVQTTTKAIQRCILMTTDPGDIVLDPTCGSGTTAFVAEQWGRRWITIDTSRIALNIAKTRLMTATYPYYVLYDETEKDIRQGFIYKKVPHITLKSLANDDPPDEETLYDQPQIDNKKLRVSGPFMVETLQNYDPISPEDLDKEPENIEQFEKSIFEHLMSVGIKTGIKDEKAVFVRVERLSGASLHAEGFYHTDNGEKKAYLHIGPKFGTVSKQDVNEAIKDCRNKGDADWLIILGFSFESNIASETVTTNMGSFKVTKARMHDDLLQAGLLKKDKKAASFVTIGEPDIKIHRTGNQAQVEICGLDIYDPMKNIVKARSAADIAYWMVDDDYDGSNFIVRQVFFCGGDRDEFKKWQKGLSSLAQSSAKRQAEKTLRIELDDEAFERVYGFRSHPIEIRKKGQKIAVRVISQFGEESTKASDLSAV